MSSSDKMLGAILVLIALIIGGTLLVVFSQPDEPQYRDGQSPADIALNYLTAVHRNDVERAYGYLSPELVNRPETSAEFLVDLENSYCPLREGQSFSVAVENTTELDDAAVVKLNETIVYDRQSLFFGNNSYQTTNSVTLEQIDGNWTISDADHCWDHCWSDASCRAD